MASRFWVGGTGTWDASDTSHWAATTGGASGASVPGSADTATFDASSGGGTVTVNTTVTILSLTMGAFTGTLDFATNNNNVTLSTNGTGLSGTGSGTRTLNMGSGTWTLSGAGSTIDFNSMTNLTLNPGSSTIVFNGGASPTVRSITCGSGTLTLNNVTISGQTNKAPFFPVSGNGTVSIANLDMGACPCMTLAGNLTITGTLTFTGTPSAPVIVTAGTGTSVVRTMTVAAATTIDYSSIVNITKAGAGSIVARNSFNCGGNTGITFTAPGPRVIGG